MQAKLEALIAGHGILSMLATFALGVFSKHYLPQLKTWIGGAGADKLGMILWAKLKALLGEAGATPDEIKQIEALIVTVLVRVTAEGQADIAEKP